MLVAKMVLVSKHLFNLIYAPSIESGGISVIRCVMICQVFSSYRVALVNLKIAALVDCSALCAAASIC